MQGVVVTTETGFAMQFEVPMAHAPERVWAAITEPGLLTLWLADAEIEPVADGRFVLRFWNTGSVMTGRVLEYAPPQVFAFRWSSEDAQDSEVRWEVAPAPAGCRLRLTHTLCEAETLPVMLAGWHTHLEMLAIALEGGRPAWPWTRWEELRDQYKASLA
ncbi:MAG TPA: SRPBCC family protein [Symbiobacteriaceae bacterium]|nr:SRPBCC family protein [Symbiobacteriaceae bacterium]